MTDCMYPRNVEKIESASHPRDILKDVDKDGDNNWLGQEMKPRMKARLMRDEGGRGGGGKSLWNITREENVFPVG